ncbi:MAG: DUF819 family protein [Planctomycetes bacterium]|nr:DUF819 family protein [Planctomycetota bacterium]
MDSIVSKTPLFTNDAVVFGCLAIVLAFVFKTTAMPSWSRFYKVVPALLLCYFLPSLLNTLGIVSPGWIEFEPALAHLRGLGLDTAGISTVAQLKDFVAEHAVPVDELRPFLGKSQLYFVASRYLLPASLVLLTLSIDLREVVRLGPKALIMFGAATVGVVLGGPLALLIMDQIAPSVIHPEGGEEVWRGMTTIAGSWIGGGANQAAMYEMWNQPPDHAISSKMYGIMITIDVIVAEIWMAFLLLGVARSDSIDRWLKADASAVTRLKEHMHEFSQRIARNPSFPDLMIICGFAFGATGFSHWAADVIAPWIETNAPQLDEFSLTSKFFWLIVTATTLGVILSFTKARNIEGAGASKIGSVFIYVLVATIGMKMNILEIFDHPGLFGVGLIWMAFHVGLLFLVAKLIRAPYFFLAVGSKANIGGAASAPVVAAAFHPSLAPVGVLLAVLGYALGTYGAWICGVLMEKIY